MISENEEIPFLQFLDKKTGIIINHEQIQSMEFVQNWTPIKTAYPYITACAGGEKGIRPVFDLAKYLFDHFGFHRQDVKQNLAIIHINEQTPLLGKIYPNVHFNREKITDTSSIAVRMDRDFNIVKFKTTELVPLGNLFKKRLTKNGLLGYQTSQGHLNYFLDLYIILANELKRRNNENHAGG